MPRLLYLFGLVNLVIGTAAFMNAGLLAPMAQTFGVSVGAVGQATTVYSLATALLAPAFLVATAGLAPRLALAVALTLFAAGNAATAMAQDLGSLDFPHARRAGARDHGVDVPEMDHDQARTVRDWLLTGMPGCAAADVTSTA